MSEKTDEGRQLAVAEVRKACRQFAMLYFHFCKTLVEEYGLEKAKTIVQKTVFDLAADRSDQLREKTIDAGLEPSLENFKTMTDLPFIGWSGWDPGKGGVRCPYAEVWLTYYERYPWFRTLAPFYCDVIDTTNIENYSRNTSHRITSNLLWGDPSCEREYFPSQQVKSGELTYGEREYNEDLS